MSSEETIIAQATASGGAIRGVVRISGPNALRSLEWLFETETKQSAQSDKKPFIEFGLLFPWGKKRSVPAKLFFWPEGRGYTGQESVEIHTISSQPILDALIARICETGLVRLANPGEFTLRAFLSGRLDLTQAEAVLGVIEASDRKSMETALKQLAGNLALPLRGLREKLYEALAHLEAGLDFADEDIEFISLPEIRNILSKSLDEIISLRHRMEQRNLSNKKPIVVLFGPPNVGKSTLFNTLLENNRAIVSSVPGTTRDYLEVETRFGNIDCILIDTAGIDRNSPFAEIDNRIDYAAAQQAEEQHEQADLLLFCRDDDNFSPDQPTKRTLFIRTKADEPKNAMNKDSVLLISSKTGQGLEELRTRIGEQLQTVSFGDDMMPATALRCRDAFSRAEKMLRNALHGIDSSELVFDEAILAGEIRLAVNALGLVDGTVHTEDLLESIFSRFCIGK